MKDASPGPDLSSESHAPGTANLTKDVIGGVGWSVLSQLIVQATRVVVGVVLARVLDPHDFGIAGMALVFSGLATVFTDLSLGAALVQRRELTERDRSTIFWATVFVGFATTAVCIALSPVVARFYGEPRVAALFAVLAFTFVFSGLGVTQMSLLTREMRYRSLQIRGTLAAVGGAVAAVVVALLGYGPWAIIAQSLVASALSTILVWQVSQWRPRRTFSTESLRDLGGFGMKLFGSRLLAYANLNADNLLVGRFLGAAQLGFYALAYNTMFAPMLRFAIPIQQTLAPALARLQDDPARLASAWLRTKRLSAAILAPAFLGMLVVAPDLVPVVFGDRWRPATHVLELLCVAGVAHSLVTLNWSVLQAAGKAGTLLRLNIFVSVVTVGAFALGLPFGIVGIAGFYALAKWLLVVPDTYVTCRAIGTGTVSALRFGGATLPLALAMAAVAFGVRLLLVAGEVPPAVRLVVVIVVSVASYPWLARLVMPELVEEVREILRRRRGVNVA